MRRGARAVALAVAAIVGFGTAQAATSEVSASGFVVTVQHDVRATPHRLYEALGEVDKWWNSAHTWSGNSANLSLSTQAGGCFCERWAAGSVEHGRVIHAAADRLLRLQAALGPLQSLALNAVLSFSIAERDGKTTLQVTYRVSGNEAAGLQQLAGPVDGVIAEQVKRLVAYVETGKP